MAEETKSVKEHLVAFRDGSYKKIVDPKSWKQSVWLHYDCKNGDVVRINLANVNYIQEMTVQEKVS